MVSVLRELRGRRKFASRVREEAGFAIERYGDAASTRISEQLQDPELSGERKRFLSRVLKALQKRG